MQLCATLLKVVLVVVCVVSVLGDGEGATTEHVCPPEASNEVKEPIYFKVPMIGNECFVKLRENTTIFKGRNSTAEEIETMIHVFCAEKSTPLRECLAEKALNVEACPNQIVSKLFNIFRDYVDELITFGCSEDGTHYITLIKDLKVMKTSSPALYNDESCINRFSAIMKETEKSTVDLPSKMFVFHREIKACLECVNKLEMDQSLKTEVNRFMDHFISKVKCFHPQDNTLVTCASIEESMISSPSICEVKTHDTKSELYDGLEQDAGMVFNWIMTLDTHYEDHTADNELLRDDYKKFCKTNENGLTTRQLSPVKVVSEICLNETEKNEFGILLDSVNNTLEVVCVKDGKRLADIMFEVYRLKKTSPDHGHAVWECVDAAKSTRNQIDEHKYSTKTMRFYHEMETFKGCLITKLHGDQASVEAARSLITEMLAVLKCANPADGTSVNCEALMQSHHHH